MNMLIGSALGAVIILGGLLLIRLDRERRNRMTAAERKADDQMHDPEQFW